MSTYELLLFLHVTSVAFWLGAELLVEMLVHRAERQGNPTAVRRLFDEFNALDPILLPATLLVLATGIAMVIDGPWSFDHLWVVIGLSGFAFIYLYGFGYVQPLVNRLNATAERREAFGPQAQALMRRFFSLWRIESAVLVLLVFDMTVKPSGDDAGVLAAMAVALLAVTAHSVWRARAIDLDAGAQAVGESEGSIAGIGP